MVMLYMPPAWLALVPIIGIEAYYGARRHQLSFRRALLAEAAANCFSTIIGIPVTWLAIVLMQVLTVPSGTGPAWLMPGARWWTIGSALLILTAAFYLMSIVSEGVIVRRFFPQLSRRAVRTWMVRANAMSYALLLLLLLTGFVAPTIAEPIYRVMEPVNEFIVGGTMSIAARVTGKTKEEPPLIEAIEDSNQKRTQELLAKGADPNQRNSYGYPALSIAAGIGDARIVKLLLDAGADVNAHSANLNDTALARAAGRGHPEIVRLLVKAGADLEAKDGSGWTPLFEAAMSGNSESVKILLDAGSNINARASSGWTALKEAQMRENENIVQQLKSAGAIDFPDGKR
jgi:hypothetical protein